MGCILKQRTLVSWAVFLHRWDESHQWNVRCHKLDSQLMINIILKSTSSKTTFPSFGARAPIWALAYLHETLRFASIF
jgi:hypothetical protein